MSRFQFFHFLSFILLSCTTLLTSCGGGSKITPEEEVREYGKYFVEKLAANQLDSLQASYPDITKADSFMPVKSDTIIVVESSPGQFDLILADGVSLKVNHSDDGNITVMESKGLFIFPSDKLAIAKKTGLWDDKLSDAQLNERMKDDEFFKWLKGKKTINKNSLISFSDFIESPGQDPTGNYARDGYHNITNKTDVEIDGSDYSLVYEEGSFWNDPYSDGSGKKEKSGKAIPPHGTVKVTASSGYHSWSVLKSIKWKLSQEQLQEKFAPYTGKEYQEYLDSKK